MNTSDTIAKIAKALSVAQSQMTGAVKDSKNPFFKSDYSDLASVMKAVSKPFADNELCFIQSPGFSDGLITVTTRIIHSSGEWLEGTTCLPPTKNDAQGYGSAITYAKRYGLQSMAGVPSVDDDGQAAVKHAKPEFDYTTIKPTVDAMIQYIAEDNVSSAREAWDELTRPEQEASWVAKSKGGSWTTKEKSFIQSTAFRNARQEIAA